MTDRIGSHSIQVTTLAAGVMNEETSMVLIRSTIKSGSYAGMSFQFDNTISIVCETRPQDTNEKPSRSITIAIVDAL